MMQLYAAPGAGARVAGGINYHLLHFSLCKIASQSCKRVKGGHRKVDSQASGTHKSSLLKCCFHERHFNTLTEEISLLFFKVKVSSRISLGFSKIWLPLLETYCICHKDDLAEVKEMCEHVLNKNLGQLFFFFFSFSTCEYTLLFPWIWRLLPSCLLNISGTNAASSISKFCLKK